MFLFNIADEGDKLKSGFNFYPLKCEHSVGFRFKLFNFCFMLRYAKLRKFKKFIVQLKTWSGTTYIESLKTKACIKYIQSFYVI